MNMEKQEPVVVKLPKQAYGRARHGRLGGIFHQRGINPARGHLTNISTGALSTQGRGYTSDKTRMNETWITFQGDLGWGVA